MDYQGILETKIRVIVGLGNPGNSYRNTRHNVGFRVLDTLNERVQGEWKEGVLAEKSAVIINGQNVILIKPQTYMNDSGKIVPQLQKEGIIAGQVLVVHDDLELSFGTIKFKKGGSHKGHNGLKSLISFFGYDFIRLRFGIGRPESKGEVARYVLAQFQESQHDVDHYVEQAVQMIIDLFS